RIYDAGPKEFLGLIRDSAFVCTNSFHGTVFAILFKKEFFCFETGGTSRKSVGSRLTSLLERLELSDRLIHPARSRSIIELIGTGIDYGTVMEKLEKERQRSLGYLK